MNRAQRRAVQRGRLRQPHPPAVSLHIQELHLRGFERASGPPVAAGLERELTALIASRGVPPDWGHNRLIEHAGAPALPIPRGTTSEAIGRNLAQSIFEAQPRGPR